MIPPVFLCHYTTEKREFQSEYGGNGACGELLFVAFAQEMLDAGVVTDIRAEEGNLRYEYFLPLEDPETILLIDSWTDQAAIDAHHASPMMARLAALREKYDLRMRVERYLSDTDGLPAGDARFIRH